MVLRGGSDAFIDEAERSLHDAIMIVRRARKNTQVVAGGGAIDMELSRSHTYTAFSGHAIKGKSPREGSSCSPANLMNFIATMLKSHGTLLLERLSCQIA